MTCMRPFGTPQELEQRRREAVALLRGGWTRRGVAADLKCSLSSIQRWLDQVRGGGLSALKPIPHPGRDPKLTRPQRRQLARLLLKGAMASGYRTELWTCQRIAEVIRERFGVRYHPDYVGPLLRSMKWSWQKPERRAVERDEEKIERWKRQRWPALKKRLGGWAPISPSSTRAASSSSPI